MITFLATVIDRIDDVSRMAGSREIRTIVIAIIFLVIGFGLAFLPLVLQRRRELGEDEAGPGSGVPPQHDPRGPDGWPKA